MAQSREVKVEANKSNIFHTEEKEQFNKQVRYNRKTLEDQLGSDE